MVEKNDSPAAELPKFLNDTETARLLGRHPQTIRNWRKAGRLDGFEAPVPGYYDRDKLLGRIPVKPPRRKTA